MARPAPAPSRTKRTIVYAAVVSLALLLASPRSATLAQDQEADPEAQVAELRAQVERLTEQTEAQAAQIEQLRQREAELAGQLEELKETSAAAEQKSKARIAELEQNLGARQGEVADATRRIGELENQLARSQAEAKRLAGELEARSNDLRDANREVGRLGAELKQAQATIEERNTELAKAREQAEALSNRLTRFERAETDVVESSRDEVALMRLRFSDFESQIKRLETQLEAAREKQAETDATVEELTATKSNLEGEVREAKGRAGKWRNVAVMAAIAAVVLLVVGVAVGKKTGAKAAPAE